MSCGAQAEGCSTERDAAERLAQKLRSSLTQGLASDAGELARRAHALGSNSLPDRDQARSAPVLAAAEQPSASVELWSAAQRRSSEALCSRCAVLWRNSGGVCHIAD